jgi:hypothetical protein
MKTLFAAVAAASLAIAPAFAQPALVSVEISNVANDIARNINVDVSQIPVTVQVPVGVAANVCGVAASVLGQQRDSGTSPCRATSTSGALDQAVQRQLKGNTQR